MAWYNSLSDLTGDIGKVAKVAAPIALGGIGLGGLTSLFGGGGSNGSSSGAPSGSGGFDLSSLVNPALGAAGMVNAANLQNKSTDAANNAMTTANQSYDARAPLRAAGIAGMQNPSAGIDLSGLKKIASHNSFA